MATDSGSDAGRWTEVAELEVDPRRCAVHAEGWQSWTPTTSYRLHEEQFGPVRPELWTQGYGGSRPRPPRRAGAFQGDGLLVVDPGTGDEVLAVGAFSAGREIPAVRCEPLGDGRVRVSADGSVSATRHTPTGGLETAKSAFAERFAAASGVGPIRPAPTIWCSWYGYYNQVTEADVDANLDAIVERRLPVDVIQLDDGYQSELGDWLTLSPRFKSLPGMVARIRDRGRRAGIWIAPFLAGARSALAAAHPDWLVRTATGAPVVAVHNWGQDAHPLDVSHPAVRDHLNSVFTWFTGIGIDFFKLDFVYAAALDGQRHDGSMSGTAAYRRALAEVRAAVGPDPYLLGCGAPLLPSVGLVDAMRISADTSPGWAAGHGDMSFPSGQAAELSVHARAYQQGRYWVNDPDCLLLAPDIEQRERRAQMVKRYGGLRGISGPVAELDPWALSTARELLSTVPPPIPFR
jgi:alpha-galactosidase